MVMIKAKIKSVTLKQFRSGSAVQLNVHESDDAENTGYGSIHPTTPHNIVIDWENALGVNIRRIESVRDLQNLIGKEVMVEFEKTENFGTQISKISSVKNSETPETPAPAPALAPAPAPAPAPAGRVVPDDDIPF